MTSVNPSLAEVLNRLREITNADLHVSLPARVENYDADTQTVDAQPLIGRQDFNIDGSADRDSLPICTHVPVCWPSGGGMRLTFPLQKGDTVLLVFSDRSIDAWQNAGTQQNPADGRRHHLSDAVAIPGVHSDPAKWTSVSTSKVSLGQDTAAAEPVATSQRVLTELNKLASAINAIQTAIQTAGVAPGDGGATLKTSLIAALSASGLPVSVSAPASATVEIKG